MMDLFYGNEYPRILIAPEKGDLSDLVAASSAFAFLRKRRFLYVYDVSTTTDLKLIHCVDTGSDRAKIMNINRRGNVIIHTPEDGLVVWTYLQGASIQRKLQVKGDEKAFWLNDKFIMYQPSTLGYIDIIQSLEIQKT